MVSPQNQEQGLARQDTLLIGIGNPLREDDRVGIEVVERLAAHFGPTLNSVVVYDPDVSLSEDFAEFDSVIIVDAVAPANNPDNSQPFGLIDIEPAEGFLPGAKGVTSHSFSWGMILAMSRDLFGSVPKAAVLTVTASNFGISDKISRQCKVNADKAFDYLVERLKAGPDNS